MAAITTTISRRQKKEMHLSTSPNHSAPHTYILYRGNKRKTRLHLHWSVHNEKQQLLHDIRIGHAPLLHPFQPGISLTELGDDLHSLHGTESPHARLVILQHIRAFQSQIVHKPLIRLVRSIMCLHKRCEKTEKDGHSSDGRIEL